MGVRLSDPALTFHLFRVKLTPCVTGRLQGAGVLRTAGCQNTLTGASHVLEAMSQNTELAHPDQKKPGASV